MTMTRNIPTSLRLVFLFLFVFISFKQSAQANTQPTVVNPAERSTEIPAVNSDKQQELVQRQIESYQAQTAYFRSQSESKTISELLVTALPPLFGTAAGGFIALIGVWAQGKRQSQLEDIKWSRQRQADTEKDARLAVAELTRKIAAGAQSMTWILWVARFLPDEFTEKHIVEHDKKMNILYSELVAAQVVVAAFDENLYIRTKPLVKELYDYDARLALLAKDFNVASVKRLGEFWLDVHAFSNEIPERVLGMLKL